MMMMYPDKKKLATLILSSRKRGGMRSPMRSRREPMPEDYNLVEDNEIDDMQGLEACMDEFMMAMQAEDAKGMAVALRDFIEMCD